MTRAKKDTANSMHAENIIIGIDPGTVVMGYALLQCNGNNLHVLHMDVLQLSSKKSMHERLAAIYVTTNNIIQQYKPAALAIEAPFFGKNVQSMLKLGQAQGVAIAAAISYGLPISEYPPKKVKQSVTGNGNANKERVWKMLQATLQLEEKPKFYDATDALAVALCHHYQTRLPLTSISSGKKTNGWKNFIQQNPQRVIAGNASKHM